MKTVSVSSNIKTPTAKKTPLMKSNTTDTLIFFPLVYSVPAFKQNLYK